MTEIIKLAKGMGLEGDNLKSFIKEKKNELREKRANEREARRRDQKHKENLKRIEVEKEAKLRALELEKLEHERSKVVRRYDY